MPSEEFRLAREQWPLQKVIDQPADRLKSTNKEVSKLLDLVNRKTKLLKKFEFEMTGFRRMICKEILDACRFFLLTDEQSTQIPLDMCEAIKKIDGVYGMGVVYGEAEVHLKPTTDARRDEIISELNRVVDDYHWKKPIHYLVVVSKKEEH